MVSGNTRRRAFLKYAGAAATGSAAALAGCSGGGGGDGDGGGDGGTTGAGGGGATGTTQAAMPELTVAPSPGTANVIFQVIKDEGLDTANNVDLTVNLMDPNSSAQAVVNRQVPTGFLSVLGTARANAQGNQIRQLWPMFTNNESCVVRKDAGVSTDSLEATLSDLQGLTIGALPETSTLYSIFHLLLIEFDLNIDDYDIRTGPPPVISGLLQDGQLDAMIMIAPLPSKFVAAGTHERVLNYDAAWREVTGYSVSQIEAAAHADVVEGNKAAFKGYFDAYYKAQALVADSPEEYMSKYAEDMGVSEKELPTLVEYAKEINWFSGEFPESVRKGDRALATMAYEQGILESDPKVDELFVDPRTW